MSALPALFVCGCGNSLEEGSARLLLTRNRPVRLRGTENRHKTIRVIFQSRIPDIDVSILVKNDVAKVLAKHFRSALDFCFRKPLKSLTADFWKFAKVLRSRLCRFSVPLSRTGQVTDQLTLLDGWIEQLRDLCFAQSLPSRHSCLPTLASRGPSDPGQGVDERAALDSERPADGGLGGPAVERRGHSGQLLGVDCRGTTAASPATPRGGQPSLNPLLDERPFKLRQRAEHMKEEFALRCRGVHLLGERTKADAARPEIAHRRKQVRQ